VISVDPTYCVDGDEPEGSAAPNACYFVYTTQVLYVPVMVWRSTDLVEWEWLGGAMPTIAPWTHYGHHWAPTVLERPDNAPEARFVMWYTAREETSGLQCLGVAVASSPAGPFVDPSANPAYCQREYHGTIDPSTFVDTDGTA
jgi:beta-xylosidase